MTLQANETRNGRTITYSLKLAGDKSTFSAFISPDDNKSSQAGKLISLYQPPKSWDVLIHECVAYAREVADNGGAS